MVEESALEIGGVTEIEELIECPDNVSCLNCGKSLAMFDLDTRQTFDHRNDGGSFIATSQLHSSLDLRQSFIRAAEAHIFRHGERFYECDGYAYTNTLLVEVLVEVLVDVLK